MLRLKTKKRRRRFALSRWVSGQGDKATSERGMGGREMRVQSMPIAGQAGQARQQAGGGRCKARATSPDLRVGTAETMPTSNYPHRFQ